MHPIFNAIETDSFDQFVELINSHPEYLNELDSDGWNLLPLSIQYQMPEYTDFLLSKLSAEQINNSQPIHAVQLALEQNNFSLVNQLLLNEKIDPNHLYKGHETAFHYAVFTDNKEMIDILLNRNADIFINNKQGVSAFELAIQKNNNDLLEKFLESPIFKDFYLEQWIKSAVDNNNVYAFEQLIPYFTGNLDPYFDRATALGNLEVMVSIIDTGLFIPGKNQITDIVDLMCQVYPETSKQEASLELANFLFEIETPFQDFTNSEGQTAWMLAIRNRNNIIFNRLINDTSETVNSIDSKKYSPLMYAIEQNSVDHVKKLLKRKANPNHQDINNDTALIKAVRRGYKDIVDCLLDGNIGIHINDINNNNESALSLAIHLKRMDMVYSLIWYGADISTNPVNFIKQQEVYQIGLNSQMEQWTSTDQQTIKDFTALVQLGLNINRTNENGDTLLLHFIKEGYRANFYAVLQTNVQANHLDSDNNSPLMCAMKKKTDDYVIGLLTKVAGLDLSFKNNDGDNVYDLCIKSNSAEKLHYLLRYDNNLSQENIYKALPSLVANGQLAFHWDKIANALGENDLSTLNNFQDVKGNSLLMNAILNNNKTNFDFLIDHPSFSFSTNITNKENDNIVDLINKLPEEDGYYFTDVLSKYILNQKKKTPITSKSINNNSINKMRP